MVTTQISETVPMIEPREVRRKRARLARKVSMARKKISRKILRSLTKAGESLILASAGPSPVTKKDKKNATRHKEDAQPALGAYPLAQKGQTAQGAGDIAERRYRYNEADIHSRQGAEQREESQGHHAHTNPHPGHAQSSQDDPGNIAWVKTDGTSDLLHSAGDTEFTACAGYYNHRKKNRLYQTKHAPRCEGWCGRPQKRPGRSGRGQSSAGVKLSRPASISQAAQPPRTRA